MHRRNSVEERLKVYHSFVRKFEDGDYGAEGHINDIYPSLASDAAKISNPND